jgi:hypothetical protein
MGMKRLILGALCCISGVLWLLIDNQAIKNNPRNIIFPTVVIVVGIILVISGSRAKPR